MGHPDFDLSLTADALTLERAGEPVVAGISFTIAPGEALMVRGDNGAGKTTLLRAIAGFARISAGTMTVETGGQAIEMADLQADHCHFLGHENGISSRLSVIDNLTFWARFYAGPKPLTPEEAMTVTGLAHARRLKAGRLSAGQKRRLALARLLMAPRALWLMDEPATALDGNGQQLLQEACAKHRAEGGMILAATHGSFTLPDAKGLMLSAPAPQPESEDAA